ncbi:uncharacterized protein LOC144712509 [Wolffia australiana]
MDLQRKFHNMRKGTRSTEDYVRYFRSVVEALDAAGQPPYEQAKIDTFLRGLGSAYSAFIVSTNANIGHLKFDEIITNLKAHEAYLRFEEENEKFPPVANNAQRNQHSYNRKEFNNNRGHTQYWWRGRGRNQRFQPRCQICSQYGHRARECPEFQRMHKEANTAHTTTLTTDENQAWYPDSGATHHVSSNAEIIRQAREYQGNDSLQIGNGSGLKILSIGSSKISTERRTLNLKDIMHVPEITKNLLSVRKLTLDNNVYIEFHKSCCLVKDEVTHRTLLTGTIKNGLYYLGPEEWNKAALIGEKALTKT